jgi:acetyl esterase/lipase
MRVKLDFQRTDPVQGVSEKEIRVNNSSNTAELRALVYYPTGNKVDITVYVYFHAGGFMLGKPELLEASSRTIVNEQNVVVIAPSYRLTPEHAFPAGVDDVWDWTLWVARHAKELGIHADPKKGYILAGESVGGNMALVAALRARDSPAELKGVSITGLHLLSSQLCSHKAIPAEYKEYYTSYEQCRDAPILSRKVQDAMDGK